MTPAEIERLKKRVLLTTYSKWLEEHGYLDTDWWAELPGPVQAFLDDEQQEDGKR